MKHKLINKKELNDPLLLEADRCFAYHSGLRQGG
jgi:hypothetical protein